MDIKTKHNVGDIVYVIHNSIILPVVAHHIEVRIGYDSKIAEYTTFIHVDKRSFNNGNVFHGTTYKTKEEAAVAWLKLNGMTTGIKED